MKELVEMVNALLIDDEERLIRRQELKRRLARISVQKERIAELRNALRSLDADSDQAAIEHEAAAGKLQEELAALDEKRIDAIVSGKQPPKTTDRQTEILAELNRLNVELETRCQSNQKASVPVHRQIDELTKEILDETVLQNRLCDLASHDTKLKAAVVEHRRTVCGFGLKDALRRLEIQQANQQTHETNKERGFSVSDEEAITTQKLAIAEALVTHWRDEIAELDRQSSQLRATAMTE